MKVLIIIPAYNEEESIHFTLSRLVPLTMQLEQELDLAIDICLIDDGSTDKTAEIASQFSITILKNAKNSGFSLTMIHGYDYAFKQKYDFAIRMDADGQHSEENLGELLSCLINSETDLVIGSRYLVETDYQGSLLRRLATWLFSQHLYLLTGLRVTDPVSGYRGVNFAILETFNHDHYKRECAELGALVYIYEKGFRIKEIAVSMRPRFRGKSKIKPSNYINFFLKENWSMLREKFFPAK